jgi:hypothetical protein
MAVVLSGTTAMADAIQIGMPSYGGTGCPQGSLSATLSPDGQSIALLFDHYVAEAGGETGKKVDRKTCALALPISVPEGIQLAIAEMPSRVFTSLGRGTRAVFSVEYFFSGTAGPKLSKTFVGPSQGSVYLSNAVPAGSIKWSACGGSAILRVNTSLRAQSNATGARALAVADIMNADQGPGLTLLWRKCD